MALYCAINLHPCLLTLTLPLTLPHWTQESPAVRKRLAVLACELRKAEASKKTFEVATEKLMRFAEVCLMGHS